MIELLEVQMQVPHDTNIVIGQSHFMKTVEDLSDAMVHTPQARFGLAFNESSGECLVRSEGNDEDLRHAAIHNAELLGARHIFVLLIQNAYPINVLHAIRSVPEVCRVFCATANPVEVILAQSEQGRGVLGVIDGDPARGVEDDASVPSRYELMGKFGFKR
ncbi:adenosine-specific kinase [Occallatibacter savannae]|uniref:adenosine-specific kinase n=1 Tax=Occallatibacter savannae TaxID=1002691 RepID=UPI001950EA7F|nr:adenosine-specific kinase [Occallatibacter savannae]